MKKKSFLIFVIVILISIFGVVITLGITSLSPFEKFFNSIKESKNDDDKLVKVNGEVIYYKEFKIKKSFNQLTYDIYKSQPDFDKLSQQQKSDIEKQYVDLISKSNETIIRELIESKVLIQEAQKLGLSVDRHHAYEQHKSNYETIKQAGDDNYKFIASYIEENDITEEEYLELAGDAYCDLISKTNLENHYYNNDNLKAEFKSFDIYVEYLIDIADIEYYDVYKEIKNV